MVKKIKKGDIIVFISIVIISILLFLPALLKYTNKSDIVSINYKGEELYQFNLNDDAVFIIKTNEDKIELYKDDALIKTINGATKNIYNEIKVSNGIVKMQNANCPHQDCMRIVIDSRHHNSIICVNGIIITKVNNNDIDVMA